MSEVSLKTIAQTPPPQLIFAPVRDHTGVYERVFDGLPSRYRIHRTFSSRPYGIAYGMVHQVSTLGPCEKSF